MRISDWSSDVCSSDLREREVMITQDEAVRHEIVRRVDEIEHLTDGPIVRVLHLLLPQPEPLGRRGPAEKGEGLRQHEREIDRQRSEEHTSELQSLMRISSAVFCLKKKIYNTIR